MSSLYRFALPALALAGSALAQNSACNDDITIKSASDITKVSSCSEYTGTITIDSEIGDDINFEQLTELTGDLNLKGNKNIKRFSASKLVKVDGDVMIDDVQNLAGLDVSKLNECKSFSLMGTPNLRTAEFNFTKCAEINIQNTRLSALTGLNLKDTNTIIIAGNDGISEISMTTTNITGRLEISHNNGECDVKLPNLKSVNNATFRAVGSLDLTSLEKVNKGALGIYDSKQLENVTLANLTRVDGALTIANNDKLGNLSIPVLEFVGQNLQVANNTNLQKLDFPKLQNVTGAFDLSGNITDVQIPSLVKVKGVTNMQSTDKSGAFDKFCNETFAELGNKLSGGKKSKNRCKGSLEEAKTADSADSGSSGNKTGAATSLQIQGVSYLGVVGVAAVLLV